MLFFLVKSYHGVSWSSMSQKWRARVETIVAGRFKYMGYHKSAIAAAWSYDRYVRRVGLDLPLNFVDDDAAEAAIEKEKEAKMEVRVCRVCVFYLCSLSSPLSFSSLVSRLSPSRFLALSLSRILAPLS